MTILAGFAPGKDDGDALELAGMLARSSGDPLHLLTAVPAGWPTPLSTGADKEFAAWARSQGEDAVQGALQWAEEVCGQVAVTASWAPSRSIATGLREKAEELGARLVVIGSGHGGEYGHVQVTSTADVLLHSLPVPLALAPRGFTAPPGSRVARATCAFRGDEASRRTLARTAEICAAVGARLRVATFAVRGRTMFPPEVGLRTEDDVLAAWSERAEALQVEALASLPETVDAETVIATGRNWSTAMDRLDWQRDEVLVVGSSGVGRAAQLFLGSHGRKILRAAPVPVIVVP